MLSILALALSFSLNASAQTTDLYFAEGRLIAQIEWIQGPAVGTESKLQIRFVDGASGTPIQAPPVRVVLWMPDHIHNHSSSPTTTELMAGDGSQVQVSKMYFVMPGRWDVRIQLTLADKNQETQTLNVVLKGQHGHGHRH